MPIDIEGAELEGFLWKATGEETMKKTWPPGKRGVARGWAPAINGSLALTFPFARGNQAAARDAIVTAMQAAGCQDTWRTLYRAGWRIVRVEIRAIPTHQ